MPLEFRVYNSRSTAKLQRSFVARLSPQFNQTFCSSISTAAMGPTTLVIAAFFLQSVFGQSSSSVDSCQALADVISICEILTPSFTSLPASEQAGCACASTLGTIPWGPASFDGLASSCAIAYASVNPTVAYDASELSGLCTSYAVQGPSIVASSTPTPTPYISGTMSQVMEFLV
jgi:hypothetical protein